jgi:hypothetical protein
MLHRCLLTFAAALACSLPWQAMANDRDLRATTVPAALCVEGNAGNANGAAWIHDREIGVFGVSTNQPPLNFADAHVHCALPLNNIDLGGNTNDNDITSFTVFYHDRDGAAPNSFVEIVLFQNKLASGMMQDTVVCSWNSNTGGTGSTGYASERAVHA